MSEVEWVKAASSLPRGGEESYSTHQANVAQLVHRTEFRELDKILI